MEFTFDNSYIILETVPSTVIFWTEPSCWHKSYSNKDTLPNDKQRITYFNYVCFMFIVLMISFHKLKDKDLHWVLWPKLRHVPKVTYGSYAPDSRQGYIIFRDEPLWLEPATYHTVLVCSKTIPSTYNTMFCTN
jgi:hypothetical protein